MAAISQAFGTSFLALHGNIPRQIEVSAEDIPRGWNLARQRYLRRCVALFGNRLATAGIQDTQGAWAATFEVTRRY